MESIQNNISHEDFEALMTWLDADREMAGKKYETIRRSLILYFAKRGTHYPEDLSDETIGRVIGKARELVETYTGNPALYFFGVARNVLKEHSRKVHTTVQLEQLKNLGDDSPSQTATAVKSEHLVSCLEECTQKLDDDARDLFLRYYGYEEKDKNFRVHLAVQLGIKYPALRVRIHRIREDLRACIRGCVDKLNEGQSF